MFYNTRLPVEPAVSPDLRQRGAAAMSAPSPFAFPGAHRDVYAGLAAGNAMDFDRAATQADAEAMKRQRDTQSQMALRGLEQMVQAQDNQRTLATQRGSMLNSLLMGLYPA